MEKRVNLFVTEQGSVLRVDGKRLVVVKDRERLCEVPILHLRHVVIFGNSTLTPQAVSRLLGEGVFVSFLTRYGKFAGTIVPAHHPDGVIRKVQVMRSEDTSFRLSFSKEVVRAKIHNSVVFLRTRRRERDAIKDALQELEKLRVKLDESTSLNEIRGLEGIASRIYFSAFQNILAKGFTFESRDKHPSSDPVNALLSLSYTLLYSICFSFLHVNGLDPFIGFFHEMKRGHASLASDIMEEFRVPFGDALVMSLINQGYFSEDSFTYTSQGVFLEREALKRFLKEFASSLDSKVLVDRSFKISKWHLIEHQVRKLKNAVLSGSTYSPYRMDG